MSTAEKIAELRRIMVREKIAAYIISGTDPHNSEYLPAPWQQRKWFSGFTGSFGTLIVTPSHVGLWTDSRYFIQAEQELAGTEIKLHKLRIPGAVDYPEWLRDNLAEGDSVGIDAFCMTVSEIQRLEAILSTKNIQLSEKIDLLGEIWLDRPPLPDGKIRLLGEDLVGESTENKIEKIRNFLISKNSNYILFSALDEIAWLFNIRCNDVSYNPVAISYAIVGREKAQLFIKTDKIDKTNEKILRENGIEIHDYHHLLLFLDSLAEKSSFIIDTTTCNYGVYKHIKQRHTLTETLSPIVLSKAVKNATELNGFRLACRKDGVALTKFFYWIETHLEKKEITEIRAAEKLTEFRSLDPDYVSDSFHCISAYGKNAALPHYSATPENHSVLNPRGLYLVDSGGQYLHGTTDITRTIPLGPVTEQERIDYTLVLRGMINLGRLIFPKGSRGCNLDIVARLPLYMNERNYGHGTGHGVGCFLNVHEGPQSIRPDLKDQEILPGMVTSNEPGLYREGSHGIRHENLIVCQPHMTNEFGEFYSFETITRCYFDTTILMPELMEQAEIDWLNQYNKLVYSELSPYLTSEEKDWLQKKIAL